MIKNCYRILGAAAVMLMAGCGGVQSAQEQNIDLPGTETAGIEMYLPAEEDWDVPTIYSEFAEEEACPELAEFLGIYFQIPEEYLPQTRYYYNNVDLNDDGIDEVFAIIVEDYKTGEEGYPAVLLTVENGTFSLMEDFGAVQTPVTISEQKANGWYDIIFSVFGKGTEDGYLICHYNPEGGYQSETNEHAEVMGPVSGTQILSNNLIDDMDKGRYMTLAPQQEGME